MSQADALIIGGGLHGCSVALHLARRGVHALVLEKDHVARHASGVNAGGVRRLGRHPAEIPLSVAAMRLWHRIAELVDDDCGFEVSGQLKVAENESDLEILRARAALVCSLGFGHEEIIDQQGLREWVPAISPHCVGALLCRDDGAALPFHTTQAFRRKAHALGARFIEGVRVDALARRGGVWEVSGGGQKFSAPLLVNAAGAWAGQLAALLGEPVPLEPIAPMLLITEPLAPFLRPVVGAASRTLSFKQMRNGTVMIGGGHRGKVFPDENRTELDFSRLAINAQTVAALFPLMREVRIVRAWAGIEACMPDDIPVIGPGTTEQGVWHAFGFSAHGFQLGPIVGEIIADLITTGASALPIAPFAIGRFRPGAAQFG